MQKTLSYVDAVHLLLSVSRHPVFATQVPQDGAAFGQFHLTINVVRQLEKQHNI